jgi:hypothetical protein
MGPDGGRSRDHAGLPFNLGRRYIPRGNKGWTVVTVVSMAEGLPLDLLVAACGQEPDSSEGYSANLSRAAKGRGAKIMHHCQASWGTGVEMRMVCKGAMASGNKLRPKAFVTNVSVHWHPEEPVKQRTKSVCTS